jgi:uncharacterized protein YkwD
MKFFLFLILAFFFSSLTVNQDNSKAISHIQDALLKKVNDYRIKKRLSILTIENGLQISAQNQCDYLFKIGKLSHEQPDKKLRTTRDRIKVFSEKSYMSYGENCLKTYGDISAINIEAIAEDMFQLWRTSKPHNANLLNQSFTNTGFGFRTNAETEEIYCVMDYGGN